MENGATRPRIYEAFFFCLPSIVLQNRYDSVPVSMMCARSVMRSSNALHNRGFGNTCVHSENGRFNAEFRFMLSPASDAAVVNQVEGFSLRITGAVFSIAIN
jgi:hypothetical protein